MFEILMVVYLLVALGIIGLVLIQQGQGAGMGASFGAGASATLFGSSGSGNFLSRTTAILATVFFVLSLVLGRMSSHSAQPTEEWNEINVPAVEQPADVPAGDVPN
ncbi:preprotein translocase subunit SecG [Marinobacter hydrocarbonoclasticus]|nr:preprotein translocase subunit SecG [Marinobacter nauticus]